MKDLKSLGVVVFLDVGKNSEEYQLVPAEVNKGFKAAGTGAVPSVYLTSADLTQDFGSFGFNTLKSKDFRKVFKDAKKEIREAKKVGALSSLTAVEETATDTVEDEPGVVKISDPELLSLTTAKGAAIKVKLLRVVENKTYVFETSKGKKIEAQLEHLSSESQEQVKTILADNT